MMPKGIQKKPDSMLERAVGLGVSYRTVTVDISWKICDFISYI